MRVLPFLVLGVCLAWGATTSVAYAGDTAAAEALFRSAREAADQGDWVTACDRFEESKRLEPAPGTVLNLARCREKLGQVASAWQAYEEAAQRLPSGDERAGFARRKAQELSPRVPKLILHPPPSETDVTVIVGETELSSATFGVPLPFDPGKVVVVVRAAGHEDSKVQLELSEGETVEHQLELGAMLPAGAGPGEEPIDQRPTSPVESSNKKTWGFVSLGVGGVGLASAIAGGIWAASELPKVEDNCIDNQCNEEGSEAAARGRTAVMILGAGSAVAVIGGSVGAYLLLTSGPKSSVSVTPLQGGAFITWRTAL